MRKLGRYLLRALFILIAVEVVEIALCEVLNRSLFKKVVGFEPSQGSYIKIERIEPGQYLGISIKLDEIEEQEKAMEVLSQLEYGGFYLFANSPIRYRETLIKTEDTQEAHYAVFLQPGDEPNAVAWLYLSEEQSYERLSFHYPLRYDNVGPALDYFDALFDVDEPQR